MRDLIAIGIIAIALGLVFAQPTVIEVRTPGITQQQALDLIHQALEQHREECHSSHEEPTPDPKAWEGCFMAPMTGPDGEPIELRNGSTEVLRWSGDTHDLPQVVGKDPVF